MIKITLISFVLCFVLERLFSGWRLPKVPTWFSRVILINIVQLMVVLVAGISWERWFSSSSLLNLSTEMNPWLAGFAAYFIATFVFYWWHRLRHESDFFWRHFHQIHHSPQRLEVITSFYKHPLEMICNSIIGSLLIYTVLGLSIEAGAIYTLFTALGEFFYHTNVKTPQWVGYIFQRPEMHRIHHQFEYHKNNYGDFVIWDMIFGTYENPKAWSDKCGFTTKRELRLKDMLLFRDVHKMVLLGFLLIPTLKTSPSFAKIQDKVQLKEICSAAKETLKEGDLIFIDIPNFLFRKVASSTKSWTSHVGIAFKSENDDWIIYESKIPKSTKTPLCDFLERSSENRFEVRRYKHHLDEDNLLKLKLTSQSLMGKTYHLGFNLDSDKLFCSKFVSKVYASLSIPVGKVQTFRELLKENSSHSLSFWRFWFLGAIPWDRRTITPASQLLDLNFITIFKHD